MIRRVVAGPAGVDDDEKGRGLNTERLERLSDLERLVANDTAVYVRYSHGWERDQQSGSIDTESGLELPGLSVNPLKPESWWTRPQRDWLARQLCQYKHLQEKDPERFPWVLRGTCVGRGPDCEPLLVDVEPVTVLSPELIAEAAEVYRTNFAAGVGPADDAGSGGE